MIIQSEFTAGCDPELFLTQDDMLLAAHMFCEGTKDEPLSLPSGGFVMYDNVAIEFGIPPAKTEKEFTTHVMTAIKELTEFLPDDVQLMCVPSATFPQGVLIHPECKEAGCDPDFNAWTGKQNIVADDLMEQALRSCGGHLHVGHWFAQKNPREFIQWMDYANGMISVTLDNSKEAKERRKLYGKAGCYRPTEYGVEYRTLSNFWIQDELHVKLQYNLINDVINAIEYGKIVLPNLEPDVVQKVINEGDEGFAREVVRNHLWDTVISTQTKGLLKELKYEA
jgi:hypothetical protein